MELYSSSPSLGWEYGVRRMERNKDRPNKSSIRRHWGRPYVGLHGPVSHTTYYTPFSILRLDTTHNEPVRGSFIANVPWTIDTLCTYGFGTIYLPVSGTNLIYQDCTVVKNILSDIWTKTQAQHFVGLSDCMKWNNRAALTRACNKQMWCRMFRPDDIHENGISYLTASCNTSTYLFLTKRKP